MAAPIRLSDVVSSTFSLTQESSSTYDLKKDSVKLTEIFNKIADAVGESRYSRVYDHFKFNSVGKPETFSSDFLKIFFTCLFDIQKRDLDKDVAPPIEEYKSLIPFDSLDEFKKIFFNSGPKSEDFIIDKAASSGKGLRGLEERVFIALQHHFFIEKEPSGITAMLREAEMLSSRFIDREIPVGSVIHLLDGVFFVSKIFSLRGAYVSILEDSRGIGVPKIVCRGTASRRTATTGIASCINDVLPDMGMFGIQAIWPGLSSYLKSEGIHSVEIYGKSLGGAIAQKLAVMIEGILGIGVDNLITVNSVGVGDEVNAVFREKVLSGRKTPFAITVIRNSGDDERGELDYVPSLGGVHLGEGCTSDVCIKKVFMIAPESSKIDPIQSGKGYAFYAKKLFFSLQTSHCRQTTISPFKYTEVNDPQDVDILLRVGNIFEYIRQSGASFLRCVTFSLFDYRFKTYFEAQKKFSALDCKSC